MEKITVNLLELSDSQNEFSPLLSSMEELKKEFIKETMVFASEWYKKTAKEYVTKYPEVTLNMSQERIAKMKANVYELVGNTEKIVKGELDNPALWWHQNPNLNMAVEQYTQIADKYPEILDRAVRHVLGRLGAILEEFRFHVNAVGNIGLYQEFWFERTIGSEQIIPFYPHLLKWTEEMQNTIRKYAVQYKQAVTLYNEIQKFKEQQKKQQALTRWEDI
jgi:hypothetical protein